MTDIKAQMIIDKDRQAFDRFLSVVDLLLFLLVVTLLLGNCYRCRPESEPLPKEPVPRIMNKKGKW